MYRLLQEYMSYSNSEIIAKTWKKSLENYTPKGFYMYEFMTIKCFAHLKEEFLKCFGGTF